MSFPSSPTRQVSDVSVSSDASKILVALNGGGLVYSDDSGSNWTTQDSNRAWSAAALSSSGTHQAAATSGESTGGLFTSSLSLSLQTSTPSTGQTGFSNKANIVLNFNNKVTLNAGKKISILRSSDNSVFEEFTLPSVLVTSSPSAPGTVTINPSGTLALNTTYHLITDASAITDDHGNVWNANSSPLSFTTSSSDTSAPTVVSKSPSTGSVQISLTDNLTITFDEDIRAVSGKFVYMCAHSHTDCRLYSERIPTSDTERLVVSGSLLTINPETELQENSTHYILIDAGAFEDLNGNDFAGITTTGFQAYTFAIDGRAPLFRKSCISSDRTKIYLLYDEALVSGTLTTSEFSVVAGGSSQSISSVLIPAHSAHVVVSLSTPIPGGSTPLISYTRHPTVGGIRDALSQRAVSLSSVDASSTSDCAGPTWVSSSPSDGATGVATNASVSLTFDEPITTQFGKSLVLYKNTATAGLHEYVHTNTSTNFSVSGNTLTIVPTTPFATNTTYSVYVVYRGFVEDLAGNDFWGWESTSILDFTTSATSDTSAPSAPSTPDLVTGSDSGSSTTDNLTNDNTPDISVIATEAGGTVTVTATKSGSSNVTCTMTGSTTGGTCTLGTLAVGSWSITAVHTDAAGNTSSASSALTITIDTTAPTAPSTPDLIAGSDTGSSSTDDNTDDNTPDISVTAAEAGGTVTVTATKSGSSNVTCTMTGSTTGGTCTLGTLAVGSWSITATQTDSAGNTSTNSTTFSVTIAADLGAPSAPSTPDLVAGSDTGSSSTDNLTNDNTPDISVIATEAGGTVTVTATKSGSSNVTCTMTGSTTGGTCTLGTLTAGEWSITAVHADAAGNTSSASSALTITIDTTAPTRVSFSPTSGATGVAVNTSPTITFGDDVVAGSGNITIYSDATCSTTFATIAGTNAQVTISGAVVTINPTTDFALSTVYCITYAAGTFIDSAGNQVTALSSTSTITFTTSSTPPTTAAPAPPATTASTTTTTVPLTARTLTITGAAMRYTVTQEGPGLTAAPSAGGGAISWTSLTPSVCSVSTIAMMSILSAQSSVEVGRLNVVGTCTISATVAATTTHSSASTSVTFTVVRARPVVLVSLYDNDHFYAKITLPREISSNSSLLRTMYGSLRFLVVSENCEINIIATYSESESEFGSAWIGLHGRPVFTDSGTCNVRAELPSGDRWFAATSPITAALTRPAATTTSTIPPTTVASAGTTVPDVNTSLPASSSTSEPLSSPPSITSFGPTSTATPVPVIELDVERQIVLESGETEIVFTRESLIKTAENVGVRVGAIRVRTASSAWMETKLPDATDLRLVIRRSDVELNIEVAPEVGDVIRIAVPIVINVDGGFGLRNFTLAFFTGAALMAWWLLVWRRRRLVKPVA